MQYVDFDEIVNAYLRRGSPYTGSSALRVTSIDTSLEQFTALTRCLYSDEITFTLSVGIATYSLRDTDVFSQKILQPENIILDGSVLLPTTQEIITRGTTGPAYILDADARPGSWMLLPPNQLRFLPPPDSAYTGYVQGWYLHPDRDALGGDGEDLLIPTEHCRTAAVFCAVQLLEPDSLDETLQRMDRIEKGAGAGLRDLMAYASSLKNPFPVRGGLRSSRFRI